MVERDFVAGTRLHGVIAALLAGTPAVLLTHDSRTREMARQAGLPHRSVTEMQAQGGLDPRALLADADLDGFNARQPSYRADFADFFDANDVPHHLHDPDPGPEISPIDA